MSDRSETNVAIACQGGGSHTAFTAGVLSRVLPAIDDSDYELVGISGTSGGALSAVAGWYGYLTPDETAPAVLNAVWDDIAANRPIDRLANWGLIWGTCIENMGLPTADIPPYRHTFDEWGRKQLRQTLEKWIDFDSIPRLVTDSAPDLIVGSVDITAGEFVTFENDNVTATTVLASAAVPSLFEAVEIDGDYYWDGLFSQNPPIRDFYHQPRERKPDELWVIQINPQTRDSEPTSLRAIIDRRNELSGNLSLNQELHFVERINDWVTAGHLPDDKYKYTTIKRIGLDRDLAYATKLDRSPAFIASLIDAGEQKAETLLED